MIFEKKFKINDRVQYEGFADIGAGTIIKVKYHIFTGNEYIILWDKYMKNHSWRGETVWRKEYGFPNLIIVELDGNDILKGLL